jgi:hypothetical protein
MRSHRLRLRGVTGESSNGELSNALMRAMGQQQNTAAPVFAFALAFLSLIPLYDHIGFCRDKEQRRGEWRGQRRRIIWEFILTIDAAARIRSSAL